MASSSRRNVVSWLAAVGAASLLLPACRGDAKPPLVCPQLRVRRNQCATERPKPSLWLALSSLPDTRLAPLLDDLEAALASVEARHHPLLVDLLGEDPRDVLTKARAWLLPLCSAADGVLSDAFPTGDGYCVEVHPPLARSPGDIPAWGSDEEDTEVRRFRFAAWPVARSLIVRARDDGAMKAVGDALRAATVEPSSPVGVVVTAQLQRGHSRNGRIDTVLERLARGARGASAPRSPVELEVPKPGAALIDWLELGPRDLLIVPKLATASAPRLLRTKLEQTLGALGDRARIADGL